MKRIVIASFAAATAASALAAEQAPVVVVTPLHHDNPHFASAEAARDQADAWKRWADDFSRDMRASMGAMFAPRAMSSKVVKGAPYSAQLVTETIQSLADGNTINRRKTGAVYRDGEGRTRQETAGDGKQPTIYISDPVEGKTYVLNPGTKRAVELPRVPTPPVPPVGHAPVGKQGRHVHVHRADGTEVRIEDGRVFVNGQEVATTAGRVETERNGHKIVVDNGRIIIDGKEVRSPTPPAPPAAGREVVVKRIDSGDGTHREEVRVHIVRADGDVAHAPLPPTPPTPPGAPMPGFVPHAPLPPAPPMPGVNTFRFESPAKLGKGVNTDLGVRDFDGVKAEGKQTTWTIPAGEIGNAKPIVITSERWYSPELQLTVQSRYHDPRTGETIYRLQAIRRGEPAPDLFRVPEDYKSRTTPRAKG